MARKNWVAVRHTGHGGVTHVHPQSVDSYRRRGWEPVDGLAQNVEPDPEPVLDDPEPTAPVGDDTENEAITADNLPDLREQYGY